MLHLVYGPVQFARQGLTTAVLFAFSGCNKGNRLPSQNARRLRADQLDPARELLASPHYDRVRVASNREEHFAISRDRDQLQRFMAALIPGGDRGVE